MRIAIVHYHLHPGGVTRVIQHALSALADDAEFRACVLTGEAPASTEAFKGPVGLVEELAYAEGEGQTDPADMVARMEEAARSCLGGLPDAWHIHNHSLGKNPGFSRAVSLMAEKGHRLLLQLHDFPEDGRPANYRNLLEGVGAGDAGVLSNTLYPSGDHVHYALLNLRDFSFLRQAGARQDCLHLLPNAVDIGGTPGSVEPLPPDGQRLFIYATRSIRRKNLGEFLLWAALDDTGNRYGLTLAPRNPEALPFYERWVSVAREHTLPVEFEMGKERSFPDLMASASALVSTSVAEGFGLSFLEPWMHGKPLLGRKLPEITDEFELAGVHLSDLYTRLGVPVDWVGETELKSRLEGGLERTYEAYGSSLPAEWRERLWEGAVDRDRVDYGRLDETLQEEVLRHLLSSPESSSELGRLDPPPDAQRERTVVDNRETIARDFGLDQYRERLVTMYAKVAASSPGHDGSVNQEILLDRFLAPERFCLLRT